MNQPDTVYNVIQDSEPTWSTAWNKIKLLVRYATCGAVFKPPVALTVIDISDCAPVWTKEPVSLTEEELEEMGANLRK